MAGFLQRILRSKRPPRVGRCRWEGKVFVIGLSGTGTRSLHWAFQMLGISSCHYPMSPDDFDRYQALSDIPVTCRFKALDELYPGARFIYTTRNLDSWLNNRSRKPPDQVPVPFWMRLNRMLTYGTLGYDKEKLRQAHQRWDAEIRGHFAGRDGDLLIMSILEGEGWEVLCPFLGAEVPEGTPFPKVSASKRRKRRHS